MAVKNFMEKAPERLFFRSAWPLSTNHEYVSVLYFSNTILSITFDTFSDGNDHEKGILRLLLMPLPTVLSVVRKQTFLT